MSDTSFPYKSIQYSDLTSSGYGKGVNEMVNNINSNFEKLANYDFHKGAPGQNIKAITIKLDETSTDDFENILKNMCVKGFKKSLGIFDIVDNVKPLDLNIDIPIIPNRPSRPINYFDGLKCIVIINEFSDNEKDEFIGEYKTAGWFRDDLLVSGNVEEFINKWKSKLIGVLPFIYLDKNIYSKNVDFTNLSKSIIDQSGFYKSAEISGKNTTGQITLAEFPYFKFEKDASFPTIYYDDNAKSFCWKFGEIETGVPAQGLPGKNGESGMFALVKINENTNPDENTNPAKITSIYLNGSWSNLGEDNSGSLDKYIGVNCIAVPPGDSIDQYWLTQIFKSEGGYYVKIDDNNKIAFVTDISTFYNWMKSINTKTSENGTDSWNKVKGLFVPYDDANTKAHMLYGKWGQNGDNWDDKRNELHLSPVNLDNGQPSDNNDNSVSFVVDYDTTIDGTLNVTGDTTIDGTLNVENISNGENPVSIKALNATGDTTIGGTLNVENISNGENPVSIKALNVTGDTTIDGTLNVNAITPSNDSLVVNGNLSCNEINGNLKIEKRVISYEKLNISGVLYKIGNIINVQLKMILASFDDNDYFYGLNGGIVGELIAEGGVVLKEEIDGIDGIPSIIDGINTQEDWCYVPYIYPPYKSGETPNLSRNDGYYCGAVFKSYISKGALKLELKNMFSDGYNPNILLCYQEYSEFDDGNMPPVIHLSFTLHSI